MKKYSQNETKATNNANNKVVKIHKNNKCVQFLDMVKGNLEHMLQAQREKAKKTRRMCQATYTLTTSDS